MSFSLLIGFMYWLYFDLRQQIYVYRRRMEEVSVMNQNLPDTLQKWHETSALLFKNQTDILSKVNLLHVIVENLQSNFSGYKLLIGLKDIHAEDEKIVADFGAKIESIFSDIENINKHFNAITDSQKKMKSDLNELQVNFSLIHKADSTTSEPENCTNEIKSLKLVITKDMEVLNANLYNIGTNFTQKVAILNSEILTHKVKIDELFDHSENITSHVASIKKSWTKYQQKVDQCEKFSLHLNNNITELHNKSLYFDQEIKKMGICCTNHDFEQIKKSQSVLSDQVFQRKNES